MFIFSKPACLLKNFLGSQATYGMVHLLIKGGETQDTKTLICRAILFRCKFWSMFLNWRDQLDPQQKHLLRVEEMQHVDWLIC